LKKKGVGDPSAGEPSNVAAGRGDEEPSPDMSTRPGSPDADEESGSSNEAEASFQNQETVSIHKSAMMLILFDFIMFPCFIRPLKLERRR